MTQISLEDVLEGVLATMLRPQFDAGSAQQTVLRLVERISAVRGRLPLLAV
ncbi:MAG TPA: hypothetical protein PKC18_08595 [Lacipirellulaceae bacterium]|nr:hypothetical protein [Lacipirellulaceae bacterium]